MSFINSTLDATGKVDDDQNYKVNGKLLKLLDNSKMELEQILLNFTKHFFRKPIEGHGTTCVNTELSIQAMESKSQRD